MTILSVSAGLPAAWDLRAQGRRTLAASVLVVGGGAVAAVVATVHRFLDGLQRSPPGVHLRLGLDGGCN